MYVRGKMLDGNEQQMTNNRIPQCCGKQSNDEQNTKQQTAANSNVRMFVNRIFVVLYFGFHFHLPSNAQIFDSIQSSLHKKPKLIGGFAGKSTFISGYRSPVFTARSGLDFDHRIRMGAGISWLKLSPYDGTRDNTPFYFDKIFIDGTGIHTVHPELQFAYLNLFLEYVYYKKGKWQFSIPIQFGMGGSSYNYHFNGEKFIESRHFIFLYEPAVSGQYKITKWLGAGLDVGYRIMIISNKNIGNKFNSPVYDIKAMIFWGELYKAIF